MEIKNMETTNTKKMDKEEFVKFVKESIKKTNNDIVRILAKDVAKELGYTEDLIDVYYILRESVFDDGLMVSRGETRDGNMVLKFKIRGKYDQRPDGKEEELRKNKEFYEELESDIDGLSEIAKMDNFNDFDPENVINILRNHKDLIYSVRSIDDDSIGVRFKKGIDSENAIIAMVDMTKGYKGFEADTIEYDNGEVIFWWD